MWFIIIFSHFLLIKTHDLNTFFLEIFGHFDACLSLYFSLQFEVFRIRISFVSIWLYFDAWYMIIILDLLGYHCHLIDFRAWYHYMFIWILYSNSLYDLWLIHPLWVICLSFPWTCNNLGLYFFIALLYMLVNKIKSKR